MRVLLDACVLYPTVLREIVLGVAEAGAFAPLWSARILEEWARATRKLGPEGEAVARGEIALLRDRHRAAEVMPEMATERRLRLPDPDDAHVLAAAIAGRADILLTRNLRDFPVRVLAAEGIALRDPDRFLLERFGEAPAPVRQVVERVHATACRLSGNPLALRPLLKRAGLPRLARALDRPTPPAARPVERSDP